MLNGGVKLENYWRMECWRQGELVWVREWTNLVPTVGLNKVLDAAFKTGLTAPTWYVGLISGAAAPVFVAGDIMTSHAGWTELSGYSQATRPVFTPGTISAGSVSNSGAPASFGINASQTVAGAFLVDDNGKGGTGGVLYGEAAFAGGNQAVLNGDTLNVTVTLTAASA